MTEFIDSVSYILLYSIEGNKSIMLFELCIGLVALIFFLYYKLSKNKYYWSDRGVPNTGFCFFWGNDKDLLQGTRSMYDIVKEEYFKFPGERFYGGWTMLGQPYLMLRNDFDLINAVWIKDFDHFTQTRATEFSEKIWPSSRTERLALFTINSVHGEVWKGLRYYTYTTTIRIRVSFNIDTIL